MVMDSVPTSRDLLIKMVADTQRVVEQRKEEVPLAGMRALASMQRKPYDLSSTIKNDPGISLIAQVKRTSPDMETPIQNYDPVILAKRFEMSGVTALAVATNQKYYRGGIDDLTLVTQNVGIPVIRDDFVYDEYQIVEARAAGADAVLLIAALLDSHRLWNLISITQRNRMTAVVQVQSEEEVRDVIAFEPRVIVISNRDMRTFEADLNTTHRLRDLIPPHIVALSMGWLRTAQDVEYVVQAGIDGIVVGQALLTAPDTHEAIAELFRLTGSAKF